MTTEGSRSAIPVQLGGYEVVKPLGQGGMADVYLGRTTGPVTRHVAIKILTEKRAADREATALFVDEARLVSLLHHHNIAAVFDVAVEGDLHYLAMEYVHGADLREVLAVCARTSQLPSYEVALSIVMQAAAGLDHAHRRCAPDGTPLRLVHRDVSLSNIMVGHDGAVKVVDFGIARSTISSVHTLPGIVRGKASYMSPEQCMGDDVDHRTDVFALGIVLYELTTGARCFNGKTDFERMLAVVRGEYVSPTELVADFPPAIAAVIERALALKIEDRFASCAELLDALEQIMASHGWLGGASAIRRAMSEMFGEVREPWAADEPTVQTVRPVPSPFIDDDAVVIPLPATLDVKRPSRWPRASMQVLDVVDDDDAVTIGRRAVPWRPSCPTLAA